MCFLTAEFLVAVIVCSLLVKSRELVRWFVELYIYVAVIVRMSFSNYVELLFQQQPRIHFEVNR